MTSFLADYYNTYKSFAFASDLSSLDIQVFSFAIQPIPAGLSAASAKAGGNRLGLDAKHGDIIFMEHDVSWLNPTCDTRCPQLLAQLVDQLQADEQAKYKGIPPTHYQSGDVDFVSHNPIFMNDGMFDQKVLESYGADTYAKLKSIQGKYDPKGFFAKRQGGFKFST